MKVIVYDGDRLPFEDKSFDVAVCNSVIEHVPPAKRANLVREINRVSNYYFIQTPAFVFPIEPHFFCPALHWLPRPLARHAVRLSPWRFLSKPSEEHIKEYFEEIQILTLREFRLLCARGSADPGKSRWPYQILHPARRIAALKSDETGSRSDRRKGLAGMKRLLSSIATALLLSAVSGPCARAADGEWLPVREISLEIGPRQPARFLRNPAQRAIGKDGTTGAGQHLSVTQDGRFAFSDALEKPARLLCASLAWSPASGGFPDHADARPLRATTGTPRL